MICEKAPAGWKCTRDAGHDGPCAAVIEVAPGEKPEGISVHSYVPIPARPAVPAQEAPPCADCGQPFKVHRRFLRTNAKSYCHIPDTRHWYVPAEPQAGAQADATIQCIHCPHVEQWHTSGVVEGTKRGCLSCDECPGFERAGARVPSRDRANYMLAKHNLELAAELRVLREERDTAKQLLRQRQDTFNELKVQLDAILARERESRKQAEEALRGWLKFNEDTCWIVDDETGPERAALVEESNEALAIPQEPAEPESGK